MLGLRPQIKRLPFFARLRHADRWRECLLVGLDRKLPADCQGDAIGPQETLHWSGANGPYATSIIP